MILIDRQRVDYITWSVDLLISSTYQMNQLRWNREAAKDFRFQYQMASDLIALMRPEMQLGILIEDEPELLHRILDFATNGQERELTPDEFEDPRAKRNILVSKLARRGQL